MKIIGISKKDCITVRAGRVFDGIKTVEGKSIEIVISGGLIKEVRTFPEHTPAAAMEEPPLLDLREHTVMPGLVDCHVHLALDGHDFSNAMTLWSKESLLRERIRKDLQRTLEKGIVAVRDGGDREWIGLRARYDMPPVMAVPRILAAGAALRNPGKYGSFLGPGVTPGRVGEAVAEIARRGADHIKVLVSGVVSFSQLGRVGDIHFTPGQLREIVLTARHQGLRVMAHASSDNAVMLAVEAGVDSIEHGYFLSEQALEAMAQKGVAWVPTMIPVAAQARDPHKSRYSPADLEVIRQTYKRQQRMVKIASETGVRLGVGTDAGASGVLHGEILEEMYLMEEAGLTREQMLKAATLEGAAILGLEKEMGAVKPGIPPCLIAVRGNPMADLKALKKIEVMIIPNRG